MKGISRINSKTAGWFVRLYRNNKVVAKFFSDGKYGGKQKALVIAKAYLRQAEQDYPAEPKNPFPVTLLRSNTSGYNGVCETFDRTRKGEKIPCWSVSWNNPPNKPHCKKFFFYDEQERKEALKDALRFRKEREAEILKRQGSRKRTRV
jgi:hypothetical protein